MPPAEPAHEPRPNPEIVAMLAAAGCVWAAEEARILQRAATSERELLELTRRRCAGEPLEYVVGSARFCGLDVIVEPGVFIPRARTEFLARCASALARARFTRTGACRALDLCCGSGAIGRVICRDAPGAESWAADISRAAVACARKNLSACASTIVTGDLFEPLAEAGAGAFDVIVANAPYVPADDAQTLPAETREYQPALTWDGGADGLALQARILAEAPAWLAPGGVLLTETSRRQSEQLLGVAHSLGWEAALRHLGVRDATILVACRS